MSGAEPTQSEEVEQFLEDNNVHERWRRLFGAEIILPEEEDEFLEYHNVFVEWRRKFGAELIPIKTVDQFLIENHFPVQWRRLLRAELIQIEEVTKFQEDNNVLEEWRRLFGENQVVLDGIRYILAGIRADNSVPERQRVLRAFSFLPPEHVKVVIVGHDPIRNPELATGLAFSFPPNAMIDDDVGGLSRSNNLLQGRAVRMVHDALCEAGILEQGGTYDCCHEVWATRGVLLLNASLTRTGGRKDFMPGFVPEILLQVARRSQASPVFVACWGSDADVVGTNFSTMPGLAGITPQVIRYKERQKTRGEPDGAKFVIYIGDHPTYSSNKENCYLLQAAQQFREMNERYPGLFALEKLAVAAERRPDDIETDELEDTRQMLAGASLSENNANN